MGHAKTPPRDGGTPAEKTAAEKIAAMERAAQAQRATTPVPAAPYVTASREQAEEAAATTAAAETLLNDAQASSAVERRMAQLEELFATQTARVTAALGKLGFSACGLPWANGAAPPRDEGAPPEEPLVASPGPPPLDAIYTIYIMEGADDAGREPVMVGINGAQRFLPRGRYTQVTAGELDVLNNAIYEGERYPMVGDQTVATKDSTAPFRLSKAVPYRERRFQLMVHDVPHLTRKEEPLAPHQESHQEWDRWGRQGRPQGVGGLASRIPSAGALACALSWGASALAKGVGGLLTAAVVLWCWSDAGAVTSLATTDCTAGAVLGTIGQQCTDLDDGKLWTCTAPSAGGAPDVCDAPGDWLQTGVSVEGTPGITSLNAATGAAQTIVGTAPVAVATTPETNTTTVSLGKSLAGDEESIPTIASNAPDGRCVQTKAGGGLEVTDAPCGTGDGGGGGGGAQANTSADPPSATDDAAAGYDIGSVWVHTTPDPDAIYIASDVTEGAAQWQLVTNAGDGGDGGGAGGTPTWQAVADVQRWIMNASSQATAPMIGVDLNGDGDFADANEGGRGWYYDPALGNVEFVQPAAHAVLNISPSFAAIWQHNGVEAMRLDDKALKFANTWRPLHSIEVQGFEVGACTYAEAALAANKPKAGWVTCTKADTDGIDFDFMTPTNWDAGAVTVRLKAVNLAGSPAGNLVLSCSGTAVSDNDVIPNKSTTGEQNVTLTFATQYREETAVSAPITLNGTPTAGDHVYMHCDVDVAGSTTTQMGNIRLHPVVKVSYTKTQLGE